LVSGNHPKRGRRAGDRRLRRRDRETLSLGNVRPYDWAIGRRVECNFKGAGTWYPGVIASLAGETIGINYDDGDRERTKTGRCRSR
jgi:hypothetical protein